MPAENDTLKRLLIKFAIDRSEFDKGVKDIKAQLDQLHVSQKTASTQRVQQSQQDATVQKQQLDIATRVLAEAQKQTTVLNQQAKARHVNLDDMKKELVAEKSKLDVKTAQLRLLASEGQVTGIVLKNLEKELSLERQRLAVQAAQLRSASSGIPRSAEGGSIFGDSMRGLTRGLFGGGFLGGVAGGAFFGGLTGTAVVEGVTFLAEKVRELVGELSKASGPAQQLRMEFEQLATKSGRNAEELIQGLSKATRGLVDDTKLYQMANTFMASGVKMSSQQMLELTTNVTKLARANAKSVPDALNAMQRALQGGRPMLLAYATGLSTVDLRMTNLPRGIDPVIQKSLQLQQVFAVLAKQAKGIQDPITTLPELFQQLHTAETNFIEDIAEGALSGGKFNASVAEMSKNLAAMGPQLDDIAKTIGVSLANGIKFVTDHFGDLKLAAEAFLALKLLGNISSLVTKFGDWKGSIVGLTKALWDLLAAEEGAANIGFGASVGRAAGIGIGGAATGVGVVGAITALLAVTQKIYDWLITKFGDKGNEKDYIRARGTILDPDKLMAEARGAGEIPPVTLNQNRKQYTGPDLGGPSGTITPDVPPLNLELQKQLAEAELKINEAKLKQKYEDLQLEVDKENELLKQNYQLGLMSLTDYIAKEKSQRQKAHDLRVAEIKQEADLQKRRLSTENNFLIANINEQQKSLRSQMAAASPEQQTQINGQIDSLESEKVGLTNPKLLALKRLEIEQETNEKIKLEDAKLWKELFTLTDQGLMDQIEARKAFQQEIVKLTRDEIAEEQRVLEDKFKDGFVSANTYLEKRKSLIAQERDAVLAEMEQELTDAEKSEKEKASIKVKMIDVVIDANNKLAQLEREADAKRVEALTNQYGHIHELFTTQEELAQAAVAGGQVGAVGQNVQAMEQIKSLNEEYLRQLNEQLNVVEPYSKEWFQIAKTVGQVTKEQVQLNTEIAKAKDIAGPLAGIFGEIANDLGSILGPKTKSWLEAMAKSLEQFSKLQTGLGAQVGGVGGVFRTLGAQITGLFKKTSAPGVTDTAEQTLDKALRNSSTQLDSFRQGLKDTVASTNKTMAAVPDGLKDAVKGMGGSVGDVKSALATLVAACQQAAQDIANAGKGGGTAGGTSSPLRIGVSAPELLHPQPSGEDTGFTIHRDVFAPAPVDSGPSMSDLSSVDTIFTQLSKSGSELDKTLTDTAKPVSNFGTKLAGLVGTIQGVIGMISSTISAFSQVGQSGSTLGGIGKGAITGLSEGAKYGSMFGPIGTAIGAAVGATAGAIFGGISGHKNAQATKYVDQITSKLQGIHDAVANGTLGVGQALQNVIAIQQQAHSAANGDKAAASAYRKVYPELQKEIDQLEQQIQKTLKDLHNSLDVVTAPTAFQPLIESLDQIIAKYKEYAEAAVGSATEVANAHLWLKKSLENYLQTLGTQLNDEQQQAVQNAIQLIDLQKQELDLDKQHAQNVYDILSQGVLARQRTTAQTKGSQIQSENTQYSAQKQNMEDERKLMQYRYSMEQKIFGLSQDRVSMEQKLLSLQEQQVDQQVKSITALMSVMNAIQKGIASGASPTTLDQLLQMMNLPNLGQKKGQKTATIADIPSQWQEYVRVIQTAVPDILTQLQGAEQNSGTRQFLLNEFGSSEIVNILHAAHGEDWLGNNWRAFLQWVSQGTPGLPAPPSFATGGRVHETGLAMVHEGEEIRSNGNLIDERRGVGRNIENVIEKSFIRITDKMTESNQLGAHQQIYDLAQSRIGMEHDLLGQQRAQSNLEMSRMAMMSDLLGQMSKMGGNFGVSSLEGALAKIYELRGRFGSAGFRREVL